jgi:hypothetical protein
MINPLDLHRSTLFGSRGADIALALQYVDELATASSDSVAVHTAARVLLNTCANAVAQVMNAPSPERLALMELIDQRIDDHKLIREDDVDQKIHDWMDSNVDHDDLINDWMEDHLSDHIENINLVVRVG